MKKRSIYKAAVGVVIFEIIMKIIAFAKQSVVAYYFGASKETDIYFVANDFMVSVSETIISAAKVAIMGIYASILIKEGKKHGDKIMSKFIMFFIPIILLIIGLITIMSPVLSKVLAPSFDTQQSNELQKYIIFLSGILIFTIIIMIFEAILNTNEVFIVSRIRSLIYSLCVIIACIYSYNKGIKVLIIAQYVSFLIYLGIQYIASKKYYKFKFSNPFKNSYLKKVLQLMIPIMIGNSIVRINYLVDKAVASSLGTGGISALAYCQTLDQFVVVVIINSISSVMFAHFANMVAKKEEKKISHTLNNTFAILCMVLIPTTIILIIEAQNIVGLIYGRGNFNYEMIILTATALQGYAFRYVFVGIRDIIIQGLYAYKSVKEPMINSILSTIVNIVISVVFVKRLGILSIALGTSISAIIGTILNVKSFKKVNKDYNFAPLKNILFKGAVASLIVILINISLLKFIKINRLLEFVIISTITYFVFFFIMYLLKVKELNFLIDKIKNILPIQRKKNWNDTV